MHLVELMAVVAVLAVLLAAGWPTLHSMLLRHVRTPPVAQPAVQTFAAARYQAIMRRNLIGICASTDGHHCGDDWSQGWVIYRTSGRREPPSSADAILMHQAGLSEHQDPGNQASSGRPQLYFQPDGRSPGANLTLRICADGREHSRIIVSNSGRVRSTRTRTDRPC
ncbi:MAG: GspH/FimT family protein [Stenotrophomonas maltophilia]